MSYPTDLDDRIKKYLTDNNEEWDNYKHKIYIQNTNKTELLVIEEWEYKCKPPTSKQLSIPSLKILLIK